MWKHLSFFTAVLVALAAGGMGLTGDAAEQKPDKRIVADLKDGMRIVGLPLKETLWLDRPGIGLELVPLAGVEALEIPEKGPASVHFADGKTLHGDLVDAGVLLAVAWGEALVPLRPGSRLAWRTAQWLGQDSERAVQAAVRGVLNSAELAPWRADLTLRLVVGLRDGSVLVGRTDLEALTFQNQEVGMIELRLEDIESLFTGTHEAPAQVRCRDGKTYRGIVYMPPLFLDTAIGALNLSSERVRCITVLQPGYWAKKGTITIFNPGEERTDYQVRLVIPQDVGMQSDFDDLRLADAWGNALPYWLETYDAELAIVWVRVPRIPSGTTRLDMYYGNTTVSSASNGDATFVLFDDFEKGFDGRKWDRSRDASKDGVGAFVRDGLMHVYGGDMTALGWLHARKPLPNQLSLDGRWRLEPQSNNVVGKVKLCRSNYRALYAGVQLNYFSDHTASNPMTIENRDSFFPLKGEKGVKLAPYWKDTWFHLRLSYDGRGEERNFVLTRDRGKGEEKLDYTARPSREPVWLSINPWAYGAAPNDRILIDWIAGRAYVPGPLEITVSGEDGRWSVTTVWDDGPAAKTSQGDTALFPKVTE